MNNKGLEALMECLAFLDDLNVQLLDDAHSGEEVEKSVERRGLLVPAKAIKLQAGISKATEERLVKEYAKQTRALRKAQTTRLNMARTVVQELVREFGKADDVPVDKLGPE